MTDTEGQPSSTNQGTWSGSVPQIYLQTGHQKNWITNTWDHTKLWRRLEGQLTNLKPLGDPRDMQPLMNRYSNRIFLENFQNKSKNPHLLLNSGMEVKSGWWSRSKIRGFTETSCSIWSIGKDMMSLKTLGSQQLIWSMLRKWFKNTI